MKIGVWYDSVEETLHNLGLPPNRKEVKPGFLVWETDGKTNRLYRGRLHPMAACMVAPDRSGPPSRVDGGEAVTGDDIQESRP